MEFKQFSENVTRARYTTPQTLFAFTSIAILTIVALIITVQPFSKRDKSKVITASQYHKVKLNTPAYVPPVVKVKPPITAHWHWKNVTIHKGDNLTSILREYDVSEREIKSILALGKQIKPLEALKTKRKLRLAFDENHDLQTLRYRYGPNNWVIITKDGSSYDVNHVTQKLEPHIHFAHATILRNLYSAGRRAGLSDYLIYELINNFAWDIDFAKDIRPGDSFSVIYNDFYIGDRKIRDGDILAASFKTQGKTYKLVRYTDKRGNSTYYTPTGRSIKKAFLRTPVKYRRISSYFTTARYHPILNKIRAHHGVDYAAPKGTPVRAAGDGKVVMRRVNGGYGNMVRIKHGVKYTTVYGHLSRFAKDVHKGSHVHQGQIIGYVGQTGLATGPHLHYEIRVMGKYVNPIRVKLPRAAPIAKAERKDFFIKSRTLIGELELYEQAIAASEQRKSNYS